MPLAHQGNILRRPRRSRFQARRRTRPGRIRWKGSADRPKTSLVQSLPASDRRTVRLVRVDSGMPRGGRVVSAYCTARFGRVSSSHGSLRTLTLAHKGAHWNSRHGPEKLVHLLVKDCRSGICGVRLQQLVPVRVRGC